MKITVCEEREEGERSCRIFSPECGKYCQTQVDTNGLEYYKFAVKIVYERENVFEHEAEIDEEKTTDDLSKAKTVW